MMPGYVQFCSSRATSITSQGCWDTDCSSTACVSFSELGSSTACQHVSDFHDIVKFASSGLIFIP